jgi:PPP family 3-phenylpropionic acid transporter
VATGFLSSSLLLAGALAARRARAVIFRATERAGGDRPSRASVRAAIRRSPVFLPFLCVLFVSGVATNAAYAFVSLRILDEGGGPLLVGLAAALPAVAEIPVFTMIGRLADRWGLRVLFAAGCLITAAQVTVVALVPVPAVVVVVRLVDGVGFALRYSSIVLIAGAALGERLRATGQSMAWLVMGGLAPIAAGPIGGLVYGSLGGTALFGACAALLVLAASLAWLVLAPIAHRRTPGADQALHAVAGEPVPATEPVPVDPS